MQFLHDRDRKLDFFKKISIYQRINPIYNPFVISLIAEPAPIQWEAIQNIDWSDNFPAPPPQKKSQGRIQDFSTSVKFLK